MYKQILGFLVIVILTSSVYVMIPESVRVDIQLTKSIFKVWENDKWEIAGVEQVRLFDGRTRMNANQRSIINYTYGNYVIYKRDSSYKQNITMNETYIFMTNTKDVRLFPVNHEIIVNNGEGKILQYDITKLEYTSETIKGITSPQLFGKNMKVEWSDGNYYSKIYKYFYKDEGKLTVKYKIKDNNEIYNVRLFDPPIYEHNADDFFVELVDYHAGFTKGYAEFVFKNPTDKNIEINESNLNSLYNIISGEVLSEQYSFYSDVKEKTIKVNKTICIDNYIPNGINNTLINIPICTVSEVDKVIPKHRNITKIDKVTIKKGENLTLRIDLTYIPNTVFDWIPELYIEDVKIKQDKWIWFNETRDKRKPININITENITDYQMFLNVTYNSDMQPDFSDLIFTDDSDTELNYWIEFKSDGNYAEIYVNWTALNTTNGTRGYMYYDNNSVIESLSNGTLVFPFFDDFEDNDVSDYTEENGANIFTQSGTVYDGSYSSNFNYTIEGAEAYKGFTSTTDSMIFEGRFRSDDNSVGTKYIMIEKTGGDHANSVYIYFSSNGNIYYYDGSAYSLQAYSADTWYYLKAVVNVSADTFDLWIDGVSRVSSGGTLGDITAGISAISIRGWSSSQNFYTDNLFTRQYVSPEPTYSFGVEELRVPIELPVVDTDGDVGKYSSVAVDSNGYVHISYKDSTNNNIKYCNDSTGSFVCENVASTSAVATVSVIVIDSNDVEHIIYTNGTSINLSICNNSAGSWDCTDIDGLYDYRAASADVDSNDVIHISCADVAVYNLTYCNNTGGSWDCTEIDGSVNDYGSSTALVVDSNDIIHIAHHDNTDNDLRYCNGSNGIFTCEIVDDDDSVGGETSIDVDSNDNVHISYFDATNLNLKYCNNYNSQWNCEIVDTEYLSGYDTSIGIDSVDNVHIVHYDWDDDDLRYCNNIVGTWNCSVLHDNASNVRLYTKGKALAIHDEFDYSQFYITYYYDYDADLYMINFTLDTCPFNVTYYNNSDYLEYDVEDINGTYITIGQNESSSAIQAYSLTSNTCDLYMAVNTSMESCMTFWVSNDSSLDRSEDYNITDTSQAIATSLENDTIVASMEISNDTYLFGTPFDYSQSFVVDYDTTVNEVAISFIQTGSSAACVFNVSIQEDDEGEPSDIPLAYTTYIYAELAAFGNGLYYKTLSQSIELDKNELYHLVTEPNDYCYFFLYTTNVTDYDSYVDGDMLIRYTGLIGWTYITDYDMMFGIKGNYTRNFWSWVELNKCPTDGTLEYDVYFDLY